MKKLFFALFVIFGWMVLTQCQTPHEPVTVYPKPYYPCYPGSWWEYQINDTVIDTVRVSDSYIVHSYYPNGFEEAPSEPRLVPCVDGKPIYGYSEVFTLVNWDARNEIEFEKLGKFLSENVGTTFYDAGYYGKWGDYRNMNIVKEKSYNGLDSVILVKKYEVRNSYILSEQTISHFTKNIGLTYQVKRDTVLNDTIYKKVLLNYHIAN